MQISYADGLANASISSTQGGFVGMENGTNSATLNFNGNATVDWNRLHVGSNETLNFNAVDGASGLTVLNRVTGQFPNIYGTINANNGISHLILSNPHGIIFDGANFNAAGDGAVNGETAMITSSASSSSLNANKNNGYIGAVEDSDALNNFINNNTPIDDSVKGYMNFSGARAWINAGEARIKAHNDFVVGGSYDVPSQIKKLYVTAVDENDPLGASITIRPNVESDEVIVGGETKELYVPQESRSYDLKFTNIRDNELTEIDSAQAVTYEDFNAQGGYNDGVQTQSNTRVNAPTEPDRMQAGSPKGVAESAPEQVVIDEDFVALNKSNEGIQNKLNVSVDTPVEPNEKQVKKLDKTISSELKTLPMMTSKKRK